jgi:thiamine pyrophosphokinase
MGSQGQAVMKECCIFGSADVCERDIKEIPADAYIIAADGGLAHLRRFGLSPDIVIGDFDSLDGGKPDESCPVLTYPKQKDDTDMMLGVKYALSHGFTRITLFGALGGRFDHSFANIQTLEYILENGGMGKIVSGGNIITLQKEGTESYEHREGMYFSVFSISDEATVSLSGVKYPLSGYSLKRSFPIGVSNEIISDSALVTVEKGVILVIYSKK